MKNYTFMKLHFEFYDIQYSTVEEKILKYES